jgi:hypothetical protein
MSSQKDFEIFIELAPLETIFTALSDAKKRIYAEDLREYSISTIRAAIKNLRSKWDRVSFPPPGAIVAECKAISGSDNPAGLASQDGSYSWDKNDIQRRKMANEYRLQFMQGEAYRSACENGTDLHLIRYVFEVAYLQAQLILPAKNGSFGVLWFVIEPEKSENLGNFRHDFLNECRQIAANGKIDVTIPFYKQKEWENMVNNEKLHTQVS